MAEGDTTQPPTYPWTKDKVLGTGGFGTVTLWRHSDTADTIALKKCRWGNPSSSTENILSPKHIERWEKEVDIMNRLDHVAVVKCFKVPPELMGPSGDLPMLCMEYCTGGDLRKVLNKPENCCGLKDVEVRACIRDISDAVSYLHSLRIIHRDLKPENIVLQNDESQVCYKLIDLGYAKELEQSSICTSFVGTLQYLAPELFLSKRYSCIVDYWSLGLVTHEIITGVRPFLPNMPPVEWMKKVMSKKPEHICVYEGRDNTTQFSATMFPECHISQPFKSHIEDWLKVLLEWEPEKRGQVKDSSGKSKIVTFTMINEIISKKVIKVFVVKTCQLLEYEISGDTSTAEVQEWVARDSQVALENQRCLLPRGQPPDPSRNATQCWAPPDEEEWLLYIFSDTISRPDVPPHFPSLVEEMLRQSRFLFDYPTQKRMYAHSIFFLQKEVRLLSLLAQAQKVSMLHLMSGHAQLTKNGQKMLSDIAKLQAKHHLFMETLNSDLDMYDDQAKAGRITSPKLYRGWREMGEITLQEVHSVVERVQQLERSLAALNTKILELQCSPFARGKSLETLDSVLTASEDLFSNLRRRTKDLRSQKNDNTDMCKLMVQALRKRDRQHQDLYKHLEKQCESLNQVGNLSVPLETLLQDIARRAQHISNLQNQRQKDIWKLMELAVTHNFPNGDTNASPKAEATRLPSDASQLPRRPPPTAAFVALSSLLEKSTKETETIITENRSLRSRMVEMLSSNINTTLSVRPQKVAIINPLEEDTLPPKVPPKSESGATAKGVSPAPTLRKKKSVETSL